MTKRRARLGGDTDTVGAIVGALLGARDGVVGLPEPWVRGICDWPLSLATLHQLAESLNRGHEPPRQRWMATVPRNGALLLVVLGHLAARAFGR